MLSNSGCTARTEYSPHEYAKHKLILQRAWNNISVIVRPQSQKAADLDIYYITGQDGVTEAPDPEPPEPNQELDTSNEPEED